MTALMQPGEENVISLKEGEDRKRVLVCIGRYLPGNKDGGPIRSIANMIAHLSPYLAFYVVTADRDVNDTETYPGITPNRWYCVGSARVFYCSSVGPVSILRALRESNPDVVVLNSFFDRFTQIALLLRRAGAFRRTPTVLAPRGEFSSGAMGIKQMKKRLYRGAAKHLALYENLHWQVSTPREKQELLEAAPARRLDPDAIYVAYNITDAAPSTASHAAKEPGSLKLAFISRMSEVKNLHYLLQTLREVKGQVQLNLFGPVTTKDAAYWRQCQLLFNQLPHNVNVDYRGSIEHSAVPQVLREHHFFVLPTRGENFCHAAVESFVNGTPVVLSDATPWRDLRAAHAGFDITLEDQGKWTATLQECVDMDQQIHATYLKGAQEYSRRFSVGEALQQHLAMFRAALEPRGCGDPLFDPALRR